MAESLGGVRDGGQSQEGLRLVATIRPVYSLLAAITKGVSKPSLLIKGQASPHHYSLRPSEKRLLEDADIIFWVAPELETFLPNVLNSIPKAHQQVRLDKSPGLLKLPVRTGQSWETDHHHHHGHDHTHAEEGQASFDPHIWLSPENGEKMAVYMASVLIQYDPTHKQIYEKNLATLVLKLDALHEEATMQLKNIQKTPFFVFHDGYQYFEQAYHLNGVGAISLNPELPMSSKRLEKLQADIQRLKVQCLFSEPQWGTQLVSILADKYKINVCMIDPLGQETADPAEDYFVNFRALVSTVSKCLLKSNQGVMSASNF
ncbi:MAG: hypothetical protein RLZ35_256 [Pseudomonadota bacterium]